MNDENIYNLVDEPWIPVLVRDGTNRLASLDGVFSDANDDIVDLALNPYERVAVFRLLLCIAQSALGPGGLKDEADWKAAKPLVGPASSKYLAKWHDRFFLYGPHAFMQPDCIGLAKSGGAATREKLILSLAVGNKSTLFDHGAVAPNRPLDDSTLAIGLLAYLNFSAGGLSSQCVWDGKPTEKIIQGAPLRERSMLVSMLMGKSLMETIWLNLQTDKWVKDSLGTTWGKPFWEIEVLSRTATNKNERTFLGHLVPLSRAVKLASGESSCILGEALQYPQLPEWRDPMASVKCLKDTKGNKVTDTYVSSDPSKMPWRELASILSVKETGGRKSALALRHLNSLTSEQEFTLWTGGLYSEKAKEVDTVEWMVSLSVGLLEEPAMNRYQQAIDWADRQRFSLALAAEEYARVMYVEKEKLRRFAIPAERVFWDLLAEPGNQRLVQDVNSETYLEDWKKAVGSMAKEAYRRTCPATTARQMEAFAQGFAKLPVWEGKKNERKEGMAD